MFTFSVVLQTVQVRVALPDVVQVAGVITVCVPHVCAFLVTGFVSFSLHMEQTCEICPSSEQVASLSVFHSDHWWLHAAKAVGTKLSISAHVNSSDKSLCDFCFINFLPSYSRKLRFRAEALVEPSYRGTIANQCEKTVSNLHRNCIIS